MSPADAIDQGLDALHRDATGEAELAWAQAGDLAHAALRKNSTDELAWWDLATSLALRGDTDAAHRAFLAALKLLLGSRPPGRAVLVLNTEKRFLRHEFPIFQQMLSRGLDAWFITSSPEALAELARTGALPRTRVFLCPLTGGREAYDQIDLSRIGLMLTASVKPVLAMPEGVATMFLSHDLMGFHRQDLRRLEDLDRDARTCLTAFASFDTYAVGSEAAAVDLAHRVRFYRPNHGAGPPEQFLLLTGYPRLDQAIARNQAVEESSGTDLLVAPTERGVTCGTWDDTELARVLELLIVGMPEHRVVLRPHPSDLARRPEEVAGLGDRFSRAANFVLDDAITCGHWPTSRALITDTSGTAYTYAFSTLQPVIFYSPREEQLRSEYPVAHALEHRASLGPVVRTEDDLVEAVRDALADPRWALKILEAREALVYNVGGSLNAIVDSAERMLEGRSHPDWVSLEVVSGLAEPKPVQVPLW